MCLTHASSSDLECSLQETAAITPVVTIKCHGDEHSEEAILSPVVLLQNHSLHKTFLMESSIKILRWTQSGLCFRMDEI